MVDGADTGTVVALAAASQLENLVAPRNAGRERSCGKPPSAGRARPSWRRCPGPPFGGSRSRSCSPSSARCPSAALDDAHGGARLLIAAMVAAYSSSAYQGSGHAALAGAVIIGGAALMGEDASLVFIAIVLGASWLGGVIVTQR